MKQNLKKNLLNITNQLIANIIGDNEKHTDLLKALTQYNNLRARVPTAQKWTINKSHYLKNQHLTTSICKGLKKFIKAAKAGDDLRPWLHNGLFTNQQDALMNDWGIQHYHLGHKFKNKNGRRQIKRTGPLLYAIHKEETGQFYLIGVFNHQSFSDRQLLKIVHKHWPELMEHAKLKHAEKLEYSLSNSDIHQARKCRVNVALEINGDFYMALGGGYSAGGDSTSAINDAMILIKRINQLQTEVDHGRLLLRFVIEDQAVFLMDDTNDRFCQIL